MLGTLTFWLPKSKRKRPAKVRGSKHKIMGYRQPMKAYRPKTTLDLLFEEQGLNYSLAGMFLVVLAVVLFSNSALFDAPRWQAVADLSRDGVFTVTDVFLWFFWLFYVPGDVVISVLLQFQTPTRFFELYGESYGGLGSLILSALFWWLTGGFKLLGFWLAPIVIQTYLRG